MINSWVFNGHFRSAAGRIRNLKNLLLLSKNQTVIKNVKILQKHGVCQFRFIENV